MADSNFEGTNLLGGPFKPYVDEQVAQRQTRLGSIQKSQEDIVWENGKSAYLALASSVNIENTQKIDLSTSIEGRLIREFPHGRIVDSSYLKTKLNSSNTQIFKGLKILVDLGLLDRVGPHRYCRKTVSN